jgi:uncharacterized protein YecE (DUF72 family)
MTLGFLPSFLDLLRTRNSLQSERELHYFFDAMRPLCGKLLALLLQLPPSLTAKEGLKKLQVLVHLLEPDYAVNNTNKR